MTPAVSVIMPVFNRDAWLGAAIDSVRSQRLTDWELLIVDDGSTNGSRAVMERLGMRHLVDGDFDHPRIAADDPLLRHVTYRITKGEWGK